MQVRLSGAAIRTGEQGAFPREIVRLFGSSLILSSLRWMLRIPRSETEKSSMMGVIDESIFNVQLVIFLHQPVIPFDSTVT